MRILSSKQYAYCLAESHCDIRFNVRSSALWALANICFNWCWYVCVCSSGPLVPWSKPPSRRGTESLSHRVGLTLFLNIFSSRSKTYVRNWRDFFSLVFVVILVAQKCSPVTFFRLFEASYFSVFGRSLFVSVSIFCSFFFISFVLCFFLSTL